MYEATTCNPLMIICCSLRADIRNWMTQIKQNASSNVNKILVANKCDVDPSERVRFPHSRCYLHLCESGICE